MKASGGWREWRLSSRLPATACLGRLTLLRALMQLLPRDATHARDPPVRCMRRTVSTMLVKWKMESMLRTPWQRDCRTITSGRVVFLLAPLLGARTMTGARPAGTAPVMLIVVPVHAADGAAQRAMAARASSADALNRVMTVDRARMLIRLRQSRQLASPLAGAVKTGVSGHAVRNTHQCCLENSCVVNTIVTLLLQRGGALEALTACLGKDWWSTA